jgi:hypothetical protein
LTSQDAVQKLFTSGEELDSIFLADYLHVDSYWGNCGQTQGMGVPGDPIGDDVYLYLGGGEGYAPANQVSKDKLVPDAEASTVLEYAGIWFAPTDSVAGIRYEGSFRVVLFGFGFEGIDSTGRTLYEEVLSTPVSVMEDVLNWLRGYSDVFDVEEDIASRPRAFELDQNYPNPFNPMTTIRFTVNGSGYTVHRPLRTTLKIYNVRGQMVRTLVDQEKARGSYTVIWDGKNEKGRQVSSGIYFYRLSVGDESEIKKMILLK